MRTWLLGILLFVNAGFAGSQAAEIAGVQVKEAAQLTSSGPKLVLNGAGIRKKFFVKVYVGALYLSNKATTVDGALNQTGPKRVLMHFLYKHVSKKKLVKGWNEGFEKNHTKAEMDKLRRRLDDFNKLFIDVKKGDVILLDYLPASGTRVTINGQEKGMIPGADFNKALLRVWLGSKPADARLKQAMLAGAKAEKHRGDGYGGGMSY